MAIGDTIVDTVLGGPTKPVDSNTAGNGVFEGAPVNTTVGITAFATSPGRTVTYSLGADSSGGGFKINPVTGVVSVANPSKLDYESAPGHAYTITVLANNGRGVSSQTFTIGVNNVNEAPSGINGTVVANEDTARVLTIADFGFTDIEGNALASVRISAFWGGGSLKLNNVAVAPNTVISAADIAAGKLVYTPPANANGAAQSYLAFQVRDNGGTANGGVDTDATSNVLTFNVNAVNDAPTATNLTRSFAIAEDAAATKLYTVAPVVADIDSATVTVKLTLSAAAGTLIGAGAGVLSAGVLTYTITGTAAAVNAALAAVIYDSAQNFTGTASVGVTVTDGLNGPQGVNPTGTVSITVGAVNDAPTATNLTQTLIIAEDAAPTKLFTAAPVVADVDSGSVTATLTVSAAAGVLVGAGAGIFNGGALTYVISGTPAAVSAVLAAVTFDSAPNYSGATNVGVTITDGLNGPQGVNPSGTVSVTVNAVNDAPTIAAPGPQAAAEDLMLELSVFNFNGVSIADIDGAASQTVTVSVQHGTLSLNGVAGLAFSVGDGVGDSTMTFTGTLAAVNTALSRLFYNPTANYNGPDTLTITTNDNGNTGSGGPKTATRTVTLNVQAINDAPTATNLTQALTIGEDAAATTLFTVAPMVADIDSGTVTATLTLSAAAGTLVGAGAGVLNAGVLTYTITGTAAAVNAALAAVTYDSATNFNGATNVGVTISDGANGPQGINPTGSVSITVNPVNDAPTATNLMQTLTINEDGGPAPLFTMPFVISDVDSANVTARLIVDASQGTLIGAGPALPGAGTWQYIITGTLATVNAALAAVTFDPVPDANGTSTVVVYFGDGALAGPPAGVSVTINPVNDAPTLAATATNPAYAPGVDLFSGVTASTIEPGQTINQVVLTVSNVLDTDEFLIIDGTSVALINGTVSSVPTPTLGVNYSVAVSGNTATITITGTLTGAQAGTLIDGLGYTNTTVAPGDLPRTVTIVSLTDDGGTANGGVATGTPGIASIVNFNIPPTVDVDGVVNYVENDPATSVDTTITIADADNPNMVGATVVISSGFVPGEDVLTFTPVGAITGNFVGNTLTLSGTGTQAEYEQVLESVQYRNTSNDPSTADRILSYSVNDGSVNSVVDTATIHVAARNDEPTLTATGSNPAFTENGAAVDLFSSPAASTVEAGQTLDQIIITVTNVAGTGATESLLIDGTTVELSNGNSETTATNGMTASVVLAGGTATVTVSRATGISAAAMTTLVDNLTYGNTSEDPGNASRVVTVTSLRDDGLNGGGDDNINSTLAVSSTVAVTSVNDEPTLTTTGLNPGFTENGAAVDLFSTPVTASAIESGQNLNTLVVTVSNVAGTGATESLTIDGTVVELNNGNSEVTAGNGMTASVVLAGGTATVTISKAGGVSAAIMQSIVDALAYGNTSEDPGAAARVVTITSLSDTGPTGGANDNTATPNIASSVAVTPVNDAPVIDLVAGGGIDNTATTATFSEGAGPPSAAVAIIPTLDLTDVDNANLTGATVTLTDMVGGQDVLTVSGSTSGTIGGVTYSVSGNVVTFSGSASVAAYEAAIQAVQYNNSSENPAPGTRHFDVSVTDGVTPSTTATATVNVAAQDDAPVNTIPADAVVPTAFSNTDTAISGISIADVDAASGTVTTQLSVTNGTVAVSLAGGAIISGGANGTATLTLSGTVAAINATLGNNVTFHSTDGFTGQANLTVLTHDGGNTGAGGPLTDTDIVHIGVVPQVWYIDNTNFASLGAGGTGTAADPFRSVTDFNNSAGPGTNDYVVVRTGTGTYTGDGINLEDGQQLYGAGETLSFTNPVNGNVVQVLDGTGTRPTINVTTAGDHGIDLAFGNTVRGVNITTGASTTIGLGDGVAAGGNSVGALTVSNMSISGVGQAVDIDQGGAVNIVLDSLSSTGGAFGVQLADLSGSFTANGGAISGSTTSGFLVGDGIGNAGTGGTLAISYSGTITASNAASVVNVQDHATGAVTFSGALTHTGNGNGIILDDNSANFTFSGAGSNLVTGTSTAISISDQTTSTVLFSGANLNIDTSTGAGVNISGTNTNGNFNFTGGTMTIDATGAGNGFAATGGGTVNVTGANNHIATVGGTALSISGTTIGASHLNFHDINANGGATGIVLNNTGTSGGLHVAGTGTTVGSGGTITNTTGVGISLTNTADVSLNGMTISNTGSHGVSGTGVTNVGNSGTVNNSFSFTNGLLDSPGDGDNESALFFDSLGVTNITGRMTISGTTIQNFEDAGLILGNVSGSLVIDVTNTIFNNNSDTTGEEGIDVDASGTANIQLNVSGTPTGTAASAGFTSTTRFTDLEGGAINGVAQGNGVLDVNLTSVLITNTGGPDDFPTPPDLTFSSEGSASTLTFDIVGNRMVGGAEGIFVGHEGALQGRITGNAIQTSLGDGIRIDTDTTSTTTSTILIQNNDIGTALGATGIGDQGIQVLHRDGTKTLNLTIDNNRIGNTLNEGIRIFTDDDVAGGGPLTRASITNNVFSNISPVNGFSAISFASQDPGTETFAEITGNTGVNSITLTQSLSAALNIEQASQAALAAANGIAAANVLESGTITYNVPVTVPAPANPLMAAAGGVQAASPTSGETHLTQTQLDSAVSAAIAQWAHAGASTEQLAKLSAITFTVVDLSGNAIGGHTDGNVVIDTDAAGHGWFVDTTPQDNFEFAFTENAAGTDLSATPFSAAAGHLDLLTAVMHEMGHELGLDHAADVHDLMHDSLVNGERRLPTTANVAQADGTEVFSFTNVHTQAPAANGPAAYSFPGIDPQLQEVFEAWVKQVVLAGASSDLNV